MDKLYEIKCPSCGRTFAADADAEVLFCSYCGAKFSPDADTVAPIKKEERDRLRELFEAGEYDAVVRGTYDGIYENDRAVGMLRCAALIFAKRDEYLSAASELLVKRNSKSTLRRLLTNHDEYTDSPIHSEWFALSEKLCLELAEHARECTEDDSELARQLALKVMRELLAKKTEKQLGSLYWPQVAIEHHTIPLINCISRDDLALLCADYTAYYKKFERLPNQVKVLDAMNARLEELK